MEETTTMNTDKSLRHFRLCLCALVLALAGCNDHELPDAPSPSTEPAGLRFAVTTMGATTRVSYDGVGSMFEDNDTIGCVITIDGQYAANSAWHYCASTGMLIFDYYWGNITTFDEWNNQKIAWGHIYHNDENNEILFHTNPSPNGDTDGFLKLKKTSSTYNFYFYYPYVANDVLYEGVVQAIDNCIESTNPFYRILQQPNCGNNSGRNFVKDDWGNSDAFISPGTNANNKSKIITYSQRYILTGEVKQQYDVSSDRITSYTWTAYPCFVNHTQTSKAQINNSDFLWVSREGITSASSQRVNLVFEKKTATIEIDSDIALTDVYLQSQGELRRGKQINLQTGELTDYAYSTEYNASMQQKNIYFTNTEELLPYDNSNGNKTNYRLVLPAQDAFPCTLHFTLDNVAREIDLSTNISQLEEGTLYIIHINRAGETTFEIVDWKYGDFELVDPDNDFE